MTKILALITPLFLLSTSHAATFEILDPCTGQTKVRTQQILSNPFPSVGHFSVAQLNKGRIPFLGGPVSITSIFGTPIGEASLVVLSHDQMLAYGWCYLVNGQQPEQMAHEVMTKNQTDHIKWFFGYSEYKRGQWISMCEPAEKKPLKSYCR